MNKSANKFEFPFIKKERIANNTFTFHFGRVGKFNFIPGQYFRINLKIKNPDERGSLKYFTISSPNTNKEEIQITTKIFKSSFKKKLHSLKKGDRVSFYGPLGFFTFNANNKPKIFLAGGIGITPYHSILTNLDYKKFKAKILLIASFSIYRDVIFYKELKKIEKENPNIQIIYTLTGESKDGFEVGRINEEMIKKYSPEFLDSEFFVVGSPAMEEELFDIVKKMKVSEKNIFKEHFSGY